MEEISLFSEMYPRFHIGGKKVLLIELFSGIGAQAKALERLGVDFEHWRAVEIDKYAMRSYNAVHGTNFETSDITKIHASDLGIAERESYCYILTYSFPCQDLSLAGHQKGMEKGSGTRSGLLWEVERLLDECTELPQILLMENVPQVIGKKNIADFQKWRAKLESLGYSNYVQLMNAKDYGIPQSRNRCFMVSILGDYYYEFPKKIPLKLKLKDMLEDNVDERYYLSQKTIETFIHWSDRQMENGNGFRFEPIERERESASTITTKEGSRGDDNFIIERNPSGGGYSNENPSWLAESPSERDERFRTDHHKCGEMASSDLRWKNNTAKGYLIAREGDGVDISMRMKYHRGTVQKGMAQTLLGSPTVGVVVKEGTDEDRD